MSLARMHNVPGMHASKLKQARRWGRFVKQITRGDSQGDIARRTGINQATISRWMHGENRHLPDARLAVHVARAYSVDPLRALVELGVLTSEEANRSDELPDVLTFTTQQLIDELSRRSSDKVGAA